MLRVKFTTKARTDFTLCPRGCTQRRTINNRLSERRTFDGKKCHNCGYEVRKGIHKVIFQKFPRGCN